MESSWDNHICSPKYNFFMWFSRAKRKLSQVKMDEIIIILIICTSGSRFYEKVMTSFSMIVSIPLP